MIKKRLLKRIQIAGLSAAMLLTLNACGSDKSEKGKGLPQETAYETTTAAMWNEDAYEEYDDGYYAGDYTNEMKDASAARDVAGGLGSSEGSLKESSTNELFKIDTDKLVYRCGLSFDTLNYNESLSKFKNLIHTYGGFVEYEDVYTNSYGRNGKACYNYNATVRIPSSSYEDFVNGTSEIGDLKTKNQNVENLSQEYGDISAELEVLETKRANYLEMMKEAKKLEDMENLLLIDDRITDVEIQINRIKTRLNRIDNDVAYSYVTVTICEVEKYEEPAAESFGERLSRGFATGWENFTEGAKDFMVDVSENFPKIIITITVILLVWFLLIRKFLRFVGVPSIKQMKANRKARKEMQAQAAQMLTDQDVSVSGQTVQAQTARQPFDQQTITQQMSEVQNDDQQKNS